MAARRATRPLRIEAETASDARHVDVDLAAPAHLPRGCKARKRYRGVAVLNTRLIEAGQTHQRGRGSVVHKDVRKAVTVRGERDEAPVRRKRRNKVCKGRVVESR